MYNRGRPKPTRRLAPAARPKGKLRLYSPEDPRRDTDGAECEAPTRKPNDKSVKETDFLALIVTDATSDEPYAFRDPAKQSSIKPDGDSHKVYFCCNCGPDLPLVLTTIRHGTSRAAAANVLRKLADVLDRNPSLDPCQFISPGAIDENGQAVFAEDGSELP